jgi:hypothetical protein
MKIYCRKKMSNYGFCTDGHPGQILGIAIVLQSILREYNKSECHPRIWVTAPKEKHQYIALCLSHILPTDYLHLIQAETIKEDQYYVQTSLLHIFNYMDPSERILCLDYDHIVINPLAITREIPSTSSFVSSEIKNINIVKDKFQKLFKDNRIMQYLNTSFIWGDAGTLRKIGNRWRGCYEELAGHVNKRYLVECAFGLAALRTNTNVKPVDCAVQGNFSKSPSACSVFHYGGDSILALQMKKNLYGLKKESHISNCYAGIVDDTAFKLKRLLGEWFDLEGNLLIKKYVYVFNYRDDTERIRIDRESEASHDLIWNEGFNLDWQFRYASLPAG